MPHCMNKINALFAAAAIVAASCTSPSPRLIPEETLAEVERMSLDLAGKGFNAGSNYDQVWIRDYNTFIELSMEVMPDSVIRRNLDLFFAFQGEDGNIPDGFVPRDKAYHGYDPISSVFEPEFLAHKNTVETDQETSLIQAVHKYVTKSGQRGYLQEDKYGESVYEHLKRAVAYLVDCKTDAEYGLLTGGTTCDWGDVQPESPWGVFLDENSHICIDIYDNAMFILALRCMADLCDDEAEKAGWLSMAEDIAGRCRKYIWDVERMKYRPHLYLDGSPFPAWFDEDAIFIQGGTAIAIMAGVLEEREIDASLRHMLGCQEKCGSQTIGITQYPPYPEGFFKNEIMGPYQYQNGGDWTWYGARMVHALLKYGRVREAEEILLPMLDRVIKNQGFNEWYTVEGEPMGSGTYRGEAGVLYSAIKMLRNS